MLKLKEENIPESMKKNKQWVAFKIRNGKKIPFDPKPESGDTTASISDPNTWGTFEQAVSMVESGLCSAVGYAMTEEDRVIFVDIDNHADKCNSEGKKVEQQKKYDAIVRAVTPFNTYMEKSLSGEGVHLLARGSLNPELKTGAAPEWPLEIYGSDDKRFIIMTGHKLNDCDIEDSQFTVGAIKNLHKNYFPKKTASAYSTYSNNGVSTAQPLIPPIEEPTRSDEEVIRLILKDKKAELLWNGNWEQVTDANGNQKYSSQHYGDCALIRKICFYSGNCPKQVDRVFRLSPCYRQYGTEKEYIKFESDIKKDIHATSITCLAVYDPNHHKENTEVADTSLTSAGVDTLWKPDYQNLYKLLSDPDPEKRPIKNPKLTAILKSYIIKYQGKNIPYIPYLFNEDRNVNGGTAIVKTVLDNKLKYSYQFGDYFIWEEKRYKSYGDSNFLIHAITEILGLVEHSVFHWVATEVIGADNQEELEERALVLFKESKAYVSTKLAKDILLKYQGMNMWDDIATYYETPYINMENGVLNLKTKELLPHAPIYNQHKITACEYEPTADCPEFKAMVERLVPDADERKELQKAFGLCLAKEQLPAKKILMLLVGPANTGKTTLLNTIVETLGEYGTSVDNSLLMQNNKDKARGPEMYDFRETLMITTSESNESDKLDTGKVKALTGETTQSVRLNYSNKMDKFRMIGLIFIDSNFKPYIPPRDTATWGRLRLFPFICPVTVKDPTLKSKLVAERAGIFNWLLEGLDMVLEEKEIFETAVMVDYKDQYKKDMDTTEQFLKDCIEKVDDTNHRITTSILFTAYKNWCKDNGFRDSVRNKFYEEIGKNFEKKKSGVEYFIGLKFTELGSLYSTMTETTIQEFAKKKRKILEGSKMDLPYSILRATHYEKSKEWFFNLRAQSGKADYIDYCCWCADRALVPLRLDDFQAKVDYLKIYVDGNYISREQIEKAKEIWGPNAF